MKEFKFNLERVLKVRSLREDIAHNHLLQARQKMKDIKNRLEEMNQNRAEVYQFIRNGDISSFKDVKQAREYLSYYANKIDRVKANLTSQQQEVDQYREEYIDKRKKRQVLERLKEKEHKKFKKEFIMKNQKELDEIGQRTAETGGR